SAKRFKGAKQRRVDIFWKTVLYTEFERAKKGEFEIREYALQNIGEFFACTGEYFFEEPKKLKQKNNDLYELFRFFFNFDPIKLLESSENTQEERN
ncbi:MAG: zinc-dependent peptidase, partial [bacterium]|nr:zinc-dependent peptidase [bacterium]